MRLLRDHLASFVEREQNNITFCDGPDWEDVEVDEVPSLVRSEIITDVRGFHSVCCDFPVLDDWMIIKIKQCQWRVHVKLQFVI